MSDIESDLEEVKFIDCPYCEKFFDNENSRSLNSHVLKCHPEQYERYKEEYPHNFPVTSKTKEKSSKRVYNNSNEIDDYRKQKDNPNKPFEFQCELCKFKLCSRNASNRHFVKSHSSATNQIANTIVHIDSDQHKADIEKFKYRYRCGVCLFMLSKVESAMMHLKERHPEVPDAKVFAVSGDYSSNLHKICMNTNVDQNWALKYWKKEPKLNDAIQAHTKVDDPDNVVIQENEYKEILSKLNKIKKGDVLTGSVKNYFEQTVDAMNNYWFNVKKFNFDE